MPKETDDCILVTAHRNGRMTSVRRFRNSEVEHALCVIEAIKGRGDPVHVSFIPRSDGLGVSDTDARRLRKAAK